MEPGQNERVRAPRHALKAAWLLAGVMLGMPAATAFAERDRLGLEELLRTGDLICELYRTTSKTQRPRAPDILMVVDEVGVRPGTARVLSSRRIGARAVKLYSGETGIHIVEDLSGSVVVTTLLGCELRSAAGRCQRFSSVSTWHFDASVHGDPDAAFRRLTASAYNGHCEAWHMDDRFQAHK